MLFQTTTPATPETEYLINMLARVKKAPCFTVSGGSEIFEGNEIDAVKNFVRDNPLGSSPADFYVYVADHYRLVGYLSEFNCTEEREK